MNQVQQLLNKIFFEQETQYESPRHDVEIMLEMVNEFTERFRDVKPEQLSDIVHSFFEDVSQSENTELEDLLIQTDYWLNEYRHVSTEYQEFDWDLTFDSWVSTVLMKCEEIIDGCD